MGEKGNESNVRGTCPACGTHQEFSYLGQMEMGDGRVSDLWNCEDGYTVSTTSIVEANVAQVKGK